MNERGNYNCKDNNPRWIGGEVKQRNHIYVRKPEHPNAIGGYIRKNRLVMEEYLGRYLRPEEIVHHRNKDTFNNSIENLELFANHSEHMKYHHLERPIKFKFTQKDIEKMWELSKNKTQKQIGKIFGCSSKPIFEALKKYKENLIGGTRG